MRKIYFLLACILLTSLIQAQTTTQVNFTFAADPLSNNVAFTNTSVLQGDGLKKAYWNFGDGSIAITAPLAGTFHHYNTAGTYQVCLKIYKYNSNNPADSILMGSECKAVTLQQVCTAGFQWTDSITGNPPAHFVKLSGFGSHNANKRITEVCWNFGDGRDTCIQAVAGMPPPLNMVHKYTQNGMYNVCLRIKYDGGCVAEKCQVITLHSTTLQDSCTAGFTIQPITATPLGRKFIAIPWQSQNKKPVKICWNFGDGRDTCIQYPANYTGNYLVEHIYAQYAQYNVCVNIIYDGGCEKRKCNLVEVAAVTQTDTCRFELSEAAVNTSSLERKFYVSLISNKVPEKICWTFGDGTDTCIVLTNPLNPQQLSITHRYPAPGNYTVCAKVYYAGGCVTQRCRQVAIAMPYSNICGGYLTDSLVSANTVRFKGTGIQAPNDYVVSYGWLFGDGTTGTGQTINHTYAAPGRYNVCLLIRTNAGCESKICKPVNVGGNNLQQLIITPNPVTSTLNATFHSTLQQTVTIKIYNANGIMVRSYVRNAIAGQNNWTFSDVGTLPAGAYSMVVQSPNQFATAIFFKQ